MRLSTQVKMQRDRCGKGKHDFGAALVGVLRAPRGVTIAANCIAQPATNVTVTGAFVSRACRGCGIRDGR
jgi:hypothetical protein